MNRPPEIVSKAAFAEEIGVSKPRVSQLVKQGLPLTPAGKVPRLEALAWYRETVTPTRRKAFPDMSFASARDELARLRAERERLALDKDRGELVSRSEAEKAIFERARAERDAWIAWATRIAPALSLELGVEAGALYGALDREVRAQLHELSQTPMELIADE